MTRYGRRHKDQLSDANSLLAKAVGRKEVFERLEARQVAKQWEQAVGSHLAARSSPEKFEHGVLTIAVASASWSQELRLRKADLLARLNETAGRELFHELRFVVKSLEKTGNATSEAEAFEPEELRIEVSIPEIADVVKRALGRHRAASKRDSSTDS